MKKAVLKDVKKGDFVKRTKTAAAVYIKGGFDRSSGRYSLQDAEDMNREIFLKGSAVVYIGFTY